MNLLLIAVMGLGAFVFLACTHLFKRSRKVSHQAARTVKLTVRITEIRNEAERIKSFRLEPEAGGQLPEAAPGSHINVSLGNNLVRHYSICNRTNTRDHYRIAVKLEGSSRGGSKVMHSLREGDLLEISEPRNNFPLVEGGRQYLLFAAGIGITPILSMLRELERRDADYHLHYFTRSREDTAFYEELSAPELEAKVSFHHALEPEALRPFLLEILAPTRRGAQFYMCGPRPFMDAVEETTRLLLPSHTIHREYFSADQTAFAEPREEFEVELARSGKRLMVPADASILEVLNCNGIDIDFSCQEGICGTCLTRVLDGEPDHRDALLSDLERRSGDRMLVCVSRSKSAKLVLEL